MATQVYAVPKNLALRSKCNGKYLKIVAEEDSPQRGLLQFSEETVTSPFARFQKERFDSHRTREEIFHLRCCYNNKYWVVKESGSFQVSGGADVPEEDESSSTCTLFKAEFLDDDDKHKTLRLVHVQSKRYVGLSSQDADVLRVGSEGKQTDSTDVFEVVDLTELVELPKRVLLKGDNGKYLKPKRSTIYPTNLVPIWHPQNDVAYYLKFYGDDKWDKEAVHQVVARPDGTVRLKSEETGKFWGASRPNPHEKTWIRCDMDDSNSINQVFSIVKGKEDIKIALINMGNGQYCKGIDDDTFFRSETLAPATDSITDKFVELLVEEPIVSRTIEDPVYNKEELRIHSRSEEQHWTPLRTDVNPSPSLPNQYVYSESFYNSATRSWTRTDSTTKTSKLDVTLDFNFMEVPFKAEHEELKEDKSSVSWGEVVKLETRTDLSVSYTIPPMNKATVYLKKRSEIRDIPFSYTQKDKQRDGSVETTTRFDGLYITTIVIPSIEVVCEKIE